MKKSFLSFLGISGVKLEIVVFLLSAFLSSYSGSLKAQQTVYWKSDGINSQWANTNDNNWYRSNDGWSVRRPDLAFNQWSADGTKSHNIVIFDNSKELTTNVNGDIGGNKYHIHRIELRNSSDRTFNSNNSGHFSLGGGSSNSKIESISGLGTGSYTFNVPIVYEKASELNPVAGNLIFNSAIDNGGFWTDVWGNSEKSLTITGGLSGSGGLTIKNSTNVVLIGNALYTGQTFIDAGVLELQGDLSSSTITVASGAKLRINGDDVDINALTIDAGGVVEILAGKSLTVNGTLTNSAGASGLVIKSDASGTGSLIHSTANVNATVERYLTNYTSPSDNKYHFISSPVADQAIQSEFVAIPPADDEDFYSFDEETNTWINTKTEGGEWNSEFESDFEEGKGYLVAYPTAPVIKEFTGFLNTYPSLNPLEITCTNTTGQGNGWNLLGNPFPSAIDWDYITTNGLGNGMDNALYYYDNTRENYCYYIKLPGDTVTLTGQKYIPAMQGFMVHAKTTGTKTVSIDNGARTHSGQNVFYKTTNTMPGSFSLKATGNGHEDEVFIHFNQDATTAFDGNLDAYKLRSYSELVPMIYTIGSDNNQLAINGLPAFELSIVIPVYFEAGVDGDYSIEANLEAFNEADVYLEDKLLNQVQNLSDNPVYGFTALAGAEADRFNVYFSPVGINDPSTASRINIFTSDNNLLISGASANAEIVVTNLLGQLVLQGKASNAGLTVIGTGSLNDGIYVVTVVSGKQAVSKKISIR